MKIIEDILKQAKNYDCHIIYNSYTNNLTRFGDNEISQNVSTADTSANIRISDGKRCVKFIMSKFDSESIKQSFDKAKEKLKFAKADPNLPFTTRTSVTFKSEKYFDKELASLTPKDRAARISEFLNRCKKTSRRAYGIINNSENLMIVANSSGLLQSFRSTQIDYELTVSKNGFYGKAAASSYKDDINYDLINERALKKSDMAQKPVDIKPGKYTVIIEPLGVAAFFPFFGYMGFNALAYYENRSFANGNIGKKIFSDKLTVIEDPYNFPLPVMPFDFEGYPREKISLVENGVLKNLVTDKKTSRLCNMRYTGHSVFEPNQAGAFPVAMIIEAGKRTLDDMIKDTERGVLVTEFHYTNPLKPKTLEITGMTRNGTYLIEDGKIKKAVKNLRFTQNMVEAMNNIEEIGNDSEAYSDYGMGVCSGSLKIKDFNFTSTTDF